MNLHDIGLKYGTDKSTYHQYMNFYENNIDPNSISRFLEIGIDNGASIKTWREWFPETTIVEGWDINQSQPIYGCDLRVVDQLDINAMLNNITGIYDIILDDGGHLAKMMQLSFATLFHTTRFYIIEDLQAPRRDGSYITDGDIDTLSMIENFNIDGWTSQYATEEQREYINKNAEVVDIFYRGDKDIPYSSTAIIRNKSLTK